MTTEASKKQLYIVFVSIHSPIPSNGKLELGRNDIDGSTKYVWELAKQLSVHGGVSRVDLVTRKFEDRILELDQCDQYSNDIDFYGNNLFVIRIDDFADELETSHCLEDVELFNRAEGFSKDLLNYYMHEFPNGMKTCKPDLIHAHHPVSIKPALDLAKYFSVPLIFTPHCLSKTTANQSLLLGDRDHREKVDKCSEERLSHETMGLHEASLVISSTYYEINEQCHMYNVAKRKCVAIPPGLDNTVFYTNLQCGYINYSSIFRGLSIFQEISKFLRNPDKPMILSIASAKPIKNVRTLVRAFGENSQLQDMANLVILAGIRNDVEKERESVKATIQGILFDIDKYNLYGLVAYPKKHSQADIPVLYQMAAARKGVFANVALKEVFSLTVIEAGASGLPVVATKNGGTFEILANCQNGILVDPENSEEIADALIKILSDEETWREMSCSGATKVNQIYSWSKHCDLYLGNVLKLCK